MLELSKRASGLVSDRLRFLMAESTLVNGLMASAVERGSCIPLRAL
jgi:hypothetical protein